MQDDITHLFWIGDQLYLSLASAEWYDTATPWRYCAARLREIDALLAVMTITVRIESGEETHLVESQAAFHTWVETVFEREYPQGFARMLRGR